MVKLRAKIGKKDAKTLDIKSFEAASADLEDIYNAAKKSSQIPDNTILRETNEEGKLTGLHVDKRYWFIEEMAVKASEEAVLAS